MGHMMSIAIRIFVNGVALWVAALLLDGIYFGSRSDAMSKHLMAILAVAVIFGIVNALIKPVMTFFSLPVIVLTLGLFVLVVNAAMLELTSWLAGVLNIAFTVDEFFWDAILGSIIITIVSMILNRVLPDGR
jgi:putative membrane protein